MTHSPLRFLAVLLGLAFCHALPVPLRAAPPAPGRLACVGDSITAGVGTFNGGIESYPSLLERMLPKPWEVRNFGVSGSTLLNQGDKPYQKERAFQEALTFKPEVVVIMLGTNDTKPQNWKFKDQFAADYRDLIGKFKALESHPAIFVCRPVPVPGQGNFGINEAGIVEIIPMADAVARGESAGVIDMHAAFEGRHDLLPDRVHPNSAGAELMARTVYKTLVGKEFAGNIPAVKKSRWNGLVQLEFIVRGRVCKLVVPEKAAPGSPWVWRAEFFGHEPQTDLALAAQGFHVAYMDVSNMYGAPKALDLMDAFYDHLRATYQLSAKTTLIGMSRGGLYSVNWASRHPDRTASLYLDAPVCDLRSWPGGKGKGKGSPGDWENAKKIYGLTEEQARVFDQNPLDNLKPLAGAKVPILSVCGEADTVVPYLENTAVLKERYEAMGGPIEVILKPGVDHHPHSLKDPAPIVKFILKSVGM